MEEFETKVNDLQTLDTGAKRDSTVGKGAFELISPFALERLAKVYERGAVQKGDRNWEKGMPFSRCLQSALRHINHTLMGIKEEDHLMQAAWNLFAVAHQEEMIKRGVLPSMLNDLPDYNPKNNSPSGLGENIDDFSAKPL